MLCFQLAVRGEQSVTLSWHSSTSPSFTGYNIYYGTVSRNYSQKAAVGNTTNAVVSGLTNGTTYYFAATTYDNLGNESDFSNETSYTVPTGSTNMALGSITVTPIPVTITSVFHLSGQFGFTFSGASGLQCVVQASTNLVTWLPVETNISPFTFTDTNIAGSDRRFYRVAPF